MEAEAKLLCDSLGPAIMRSKLVMALEVCGPIVCLLVLLVVLWLVDDLRGNEDVGEGVGVGVQLEAVDEQTVGFGSVVDGEIEFEMAAVGFVMLGLVVVLFQDGRAAWAVEADGLGLSKADALDGNRLDDLDLVGADGGRKEECVCRSRQASCGKEGSKQHDGG